MVSEQFSGDYVFISYASRDRVRVIPVVEALKTAGVQVWFDQSDIAGGENYAREIAEGIERCTAFVLMCSESSFASRNCRQEIALAWKYSRPYLPLLLDTAPIPKEIEYWLEAAQWVEVLNHPQERWFPRVLRSLAGLGYPVVPPEDEALADSKVFSIPAPPRALPSQPPPLVGRQRELAEVREVLDAALAGTGGTLLIGGEAGIGKSALVDTVVYEAATRRAMVLVGHCYDLSTTPPYGPWVEALHDYVPGPGLPPCPTTLRGEEGANQVTSQTALFEEVASFLRAVANRQPLVIDLEDLHWADPASLELLRYVARQLRDVRVMLTGTYRVDELDRRNPLRQLLPILTREAGATRLSLERLDSIMVRQLIEQRYRLSETDRDRLVAYVQEHAEGHALYINELLQTLEDERVLTEEGDDGWVVGNLSGVHVPLLVREVIEARVARLPEEVQKALAIASVIGQEVPIDVWGEVTDESDDELLESMEQAEKVHLLTSSPSGATVYFTHALIREAIYETIVPLRRRVWHKKIGEALEEATNPEPSAVAYHFRQADDARAISWLVKSGKRAERAYALESAAQQYDEALQMALYKKDATGQAQARAATGELLRKKARYHEAAAFLEEAKANFEALGDRAGVGVVLHSMGTLSAQRGDFVQAKQHYQESLKIRQELNDREQMAALLSNLGIVARVHGNLAESRPLHEEALKLRRALGDRWAIANSLNNLGLVLRDQGDLTTGRQYLEEAVKIHRALGDRWAIANAVNNLANVVRAQGDFGTAHTLYAESLAINTDLGDDRAVAYLLEDIGTLSAAEGKPARALRLILAARRLREEIGSPLSPAEQKELETLLEQIRSELGEEQVLSAEASPTAAAIQEAVSTASG